jgi:hypothetical protein
MVTVFSVMLSMVRSIIGGTLTSAGSILADRNFECSDSEINWKNLYEENCC